MELFILPLIAVVCLTAPIIYVITGKKSGKKAKNAFIMNLCGFFGVMAIGIIIPMGGFVSAADVTETAAATANGLGQGLGYLAAALVTGLSCIGSGIAVAAGAPAAIGATAEEPKSFVKSLIFVVLGEGIALYGLLISILIINKL